MSVDSVLIPADEPASGTGSSTEPRYSLLLSTDPTLIESAQRLRYEVFNNEPGFTLTGQDAGLDVDRFDEHCDHLLVREDNSRELVGCYRMLSPTGAIAAGGLYTATEFDIRALDSRRSPQRRRRAADVGRHPGLPRPLRLRLRHRLRVGSGSQRRRRAAGQPDSRRARLRAAPPRRPGAVLGASAPAGDRRRIHRGRDPSAHAAGHPAADARLPAVGRPNMR